MARMTLHDIEKRAKIIHGEKYKYLELDVSKTETRVKLSCDIHGEFWIGARRHYLGQGCKACGYLKVQAGRRIGFEELVKKAREAHGETYNYTGVSYTKNGKADLHIICKEHGPWVQKASDHIGGHGCSKCHYRAVTPKLTDEDIFAALKKVHPTYYWLSVCRVDSTIFVEYNCSYHGVQVGRYHTLLTGSGCTKCGDMATGVKKRKALAEYTRLALRAGRDISRIVGIERENSRTHFIMDCPEHGRYFSSAKDYIKKGIQSCSKCSSSTAMGSKGQLEIADYLKSLGVEVHLEAYFEGSKLRWDIVCPSAKLAIEYDGLKWHSSEYVKNPNKMKHKADYVESLGYRQLNIWEDEWTGKTDIVKSLLRKAVGIRETTIGARSCKVAVITQEDAKTFLNSNHIQGYAANCENLGLVYRGELIAVLSSRRKAEGRAGKTSNAHLEVARYATKISVKGGFSRLLRHALSPETVVVYTFSDNRLFTGDMYKLAGFTKAYDLRPDYQYTRNGVRYSKRGLQKSAFVPVAGLNTEKELAAHYGYYQLYDRGKKKWVLRK